MQDALLRSGVVIGVFLAAATASSAGDLQVGMAAADVTPPLRDDRPMWMAGYGQGRRATGVHDPLMARALVLSDGERRVAIVGVDSIGLQLPTVAVHSKRMPSWTLPLMTLRSSG